MNSNSDIICINSVRYFGKSSEIFTLSCQLIFVRFLTFPRVRAIVFVFKDYLEGKLHGVDIFFVSYKIG